MWLHNSNCLSSFSGWTGICFPVRSTNASFTFCRKANYAAFCYNTSSFHIFETNYHVYLLSYLVALLRFLCPCILYCCIKCVLYFHKQLTSNDSLHAINNDNIFFLKAFFLICKHLYRLTFSCTNSRHLLYNWGTRKMESPCPIQHYSRPGVGKLWPMS